VLNHTVERNGEPFVTTTLAHIIGFGLSSNITSDDPGSKQLQHASSAATMLSRFGNVLYFDELNGRNIHRLENVMTMGIEYQFWFDNLMIWLEATVRSSSFRVSSTPLINGLAPQDAPNVYRPGAVDDMFLEGLPNEIEMTSNEDTFPVLDLRYIKLHAACARVAHMSGAGEYIDKLQRDMDRISILAEDGSSAHFLSESLLQAIAG
jgi:hypothetical protein